METVRKSDNVSSITVLWAVAAILLFTLPCNAVDITVLGGQEVTVPSSDYPDPVYGTVYVSENGVLNLLDGGAIIYVSTLNGSTVNITGGQVYGFIYVEPGATVTVFGTNFSVAGGVIDESGDYFFTPDPDYCTLTGEYGGNAGFINLTFFPTTSDTHIFLAEPVEPLILIDIKPGSYPNSVNINGHGVIPVAILGSAGFDVTEIDAESLSFAGLELRVKGNGSPQCSFQDVSGDFTNPEGAPDGFLDLVCQFEDDPTTWLPGEGTATLEGNLNDGTPFEATDEIRIVQE